MKYEGEDFYCDVAIPKKVELDIEYESPHILAYHHTDPRWPVHIVIIPKYHVDSLLTVDNESEELLIELMKVVQRISARVVEEHGAARVITNLGDYQESKHLHFHVCSGEALLNQ